MFERTNAIRQSCLVLIISDLSRRHRPPIRTWTRCYGEERCPRSPPSRFHARIASRQRIPPRNRRHQRGGLIKRASRSRHVVNAWFIGDSKSEGMASGPKQICCVDGTRYQSEISFALPADCTRSLVVKSG